MQIILRADLNLYGRLELNMGDHLDGLPTSSGGRSAPRRSRSCSISER
jgi:hypothetical protein